MQRDDRRPDPSARPHHGSPFRRGGFTFIELGVVAVVLTILVGVLLPAISRGRQAAISADCLNNLKTLGMDTQFYTQAYSGFFPPAVTSDSTGITVSWDGGVRMYDTNVKESDGQPDDLYTAGVSWKSYDIETVETERMDRLSAAAGAGGSGGKDGGTGEGSDRAQAPAPLIPPLVIYAGERTGEGLGMEAMPHCPAYDREETPGYTGFNYNADYLGRGPANEGHVRNPVETAVYGDGLSAGGGHAVPNKFMRAPVGRRLGSGASADDTVSGTQGYRHLGGTNVLWADYHVSTWKIRHSETAESGLTAGHDTGWLSEDDSLYDLK